MAHSRASFYASWLCPLQVTGAIVFANMGAAYGTAKSGVGISTMGVGKGGGKARELLRAW